MKNLYVLPFLILLSLSFFVSAQDNAEETEEVSTVEAYLHLLKREKLKSKLQTLIEKINF